MGKARNRKWLRREHSECWVRNRRLLWFDVLIRRYLG